MALWTRTARLKLLEAEAVLLRAFVRSKKAKIDVPVFVRQSRKGVLCRPVKLETAENISGSARTGFSTEAINTLHVQGSAALSGGANERLCSDVPAVLTHGYGSGLAMYFRNIDDFAGMYRDVYALDWLGMGGSTRPPMRPFFVQLREAQQAGTLTLADAMQRCESLFVESLELWRATLGLEKMDLIAHSMGGFLSAAYALAHPTRVRNLVLISPAGLIAAPPTAPVSELGVADTRVRSASARAQRTVTFFNDNLITPQSLVRTLGPFGPGLVRRAVDGRLPDLPASERALIADYVFHMSAAPGSSEYALNTLFKIVAAPDESGLYAHAPLVPRFASARAVAPRESLVVFGDRDWMAFPIRERHVQEMRAAGVRVATVPAAGHHTYLDNATHFAGLMRSVVQSSASQQ